MPEVAAALEGKQIASSGLCLYRGTGYSVQSTLCSGHAIQGSEAIGAHACCSACMALLLDHAIAERARQPSNQPGAELNKYARHDTIGSMDAAVERLRKSSKTIAKLYFEKEKERRLRVAAERRASRLESKLNAAIQKGKYPKFVRAFQAATEEGHMPEERLQNILEDTAKSLRGKHHWSATSGLIRGLTPNRSTHVY